MGASAPQSVFDYGIGARLAGRETGGKVGFFFIRTERGGIHMAHGRRAHFIRIKNKYQRAGAKAVAAVFALALTAHQRGRAQERINLAARRAEKIA